MTKKTLVTVVTANRFMAETIARAIGATSELEGYYHGNGYAVTWTNGEIIESEYKHGEKFVMNSGQDMRQMYAHHFNFRMRNYDALLGWGEVESRRSPTLRNQDAVGKKAMSSSTPWNPHSKENWRS